MYEVLAFLHQYDVLLYLLLLLGAIFAIRHLGKALEEKRNALFSLEKEIAQHHLNAAIASLSLLTVLAFSIFFATVFLWPALPANVQMGQATRSLSVLPTSTLPPELLQNLGLATSLPTATLEVSGCIPGQIMISEPKPGEEIRGSITIKGTADIPNFGFYKYEFAPVGSELWTAIQASRDPKRDQALGFWDTRELTPGNYLLRLVVTDNTGNALPPCVVPVRVVAP
ncbi:MAG: hypothetical protein N2049_08020 [Anaerolineales bacterium]|nr:hypothetical protein [Anaerolineales bacterium]